MLLVHRGIGIIRVEAPTLGDQSGLDPPLHSNAFMGTCITLAIIIYTDSLCLRL